MKNESKMFGVFFLFHEELPAKIWQKQTQPGQAGIFNVGLLTWFPRNCKTIGEKKSDFLTAAEIPLN